MLLKRRPKDDLNDALGIFNGLIMGGVMWASIIGGYFALTGCATTPPAYEICNTPNCGDNVAIEVDK